MTAVYLSWTNTHSFWIATSVEISSCSPILHPKTKDIHVALSSSLQISHHTNRVLVAVEVLKNWTVSFVLIIFDLTFVWYLRNTGLSGSMFFWGLENFFSQFATSFLQNTWGLSLKTGRPITQSNQQLLSATLLIRNITNICARPPRITPGG